MNKTQEIARHIVKLNYDDIPAGILKDMKSLLLDYLGVALKGSKTSSGEIAAGFVRDLKEVEESTLIGYGNRVSAHSAAFCNAISSHSIELDDTDSQAYFHFSPVIVSATLAMAEREKISGKDFLVGLVVGCDVLARLSCTVNPALRNRGFHTTPTCGVFGAAAAAGKLLKLTEEQQTSALGLAGAQSSGLMEMYGSSMQKRFNPAPAASGGVIAALMAQRGFTGAETIFEGERGFCKAFAGITDLTNLTADLGKDFPIFIEHKPYASARPIHNAIDCAIEIRNKYKPNIPNIKEIIVRRHPDWAEYHGNTEPQNYHEAQVSLPYSVAIALIEGKAFIQQYSEDKIKDPRVQHLTRKVSIAADGTLPCGVSCLMEVYMKDGEVYRSQVDYAKGSRENPMTPGELQNKFNSLTEGVLDSNKRTKIISTIERLEKVADISEIRKLLY